MTDRKDGAAAGALPQVVNEAQEPQKSLSAAAARALAEAAERRAARARAQARAPTELAGRGGLDPVRYGDWEVKGLASDF
jgi:hypothetical protein